MQPVSLFADSDVMGLLLAALAALSFVILDVLRKILGRRLPTAVIVIGINLGSALVFLFALSVRGGWACDSTFVLIATIETMTFTVASILYVQAVTLSPLSLTIPYLAFTPVISALIGVFALGEIPSQRGFTGIALVVIGALLLHTGDVGRFRDLLYAPLREPGSWRMLVVAGIFGVTTVLDKIAIRHGSEPLLGLALTLGSSIILVCAVFLSSSLMPSEALSELEKRKPWKEPLLYLAALVAGVAVLSQFFAYSYLFVSYVETIKRAGGLFSVLIGTVIFREGNLSRRLPAAALMVLGIALIIS